MGHIQQGWRWPSLGDMHAGEELAYCVRSQLGSYGTGPGV